MKKEAAMNDINALITELTQKMECCLEQEDYGRADELCREICRMEGLEPVESMPEDFLFQLKKKESETMNKKKITKRFSGVAVAAAAFLVIGGTVSAAAAYNGGIRFFDHGLIAGDDSVDFSEVAGIVGANPQELSGEPVVTPISTEDGSTDTPWLSKNVWEETSEVYESDDGVNWTKGYQTARITEYRYADYFAAVEDAGFDSLFKTNYSGEVLYDQSEYLEDGADADYSISGTFSYGNGSFGIEQMKFRAGTSEETEDEVLMVITTTQETANERDYISSVGIPFRLSDDTEFGYTRTTTVFKGKSFNAVLTFTGMTEEEIHQVLDNIQP